MIIRINPNGQANGTAGPQLIRVVLRFRTTMIIGDPDAALDHCWDGALSRFSELAGSPGSDAPVGYDRLSFR